jgi:hypothetical protein
MGRFVQFSCFICFREKAFLEHDTGRRRGRGEGPRGEGERDGKTE